MNFILCNKYTFLSLIHFLQLLLTSLIQWRPEQSILHCKTNSPQPAFNDVFDAIIHNQAKLDANINTVCSKSTHINSTITEPKVHIQYSSSFGFLNKSCLSIICNIKVRFYVCLSMICNIKVRFYVKLNACNVMFFQYTHLS